MDDVWTDERIEMARQLYLAGKPASHIAAEIGGGISRNAVIGKAHRSGWHKLPRETAVVVPFVQPLRPPPKPETSPGGAETKRLYGNPAAKVKNSLLRHGQTPAERKAHYEAEAEKTRERFESESEEPVAGVTIIELTETSCRWPKGDAADRNFRYCGEPKPSGPAHPYCKTHAALAFENPRRRAARVAVSRRPKISGLSLRNV